MENKSHTRTFLYATLGILLFASSSAVVAMPGVVSAAKAGPHLGAHFCKATLLGSWTGKTKTCTLTADAALSTSPDITIPAGDTLVIQGGTLTVNTVVYNDGAIAVSSGTFDNTGAINNNPGGTIKNGGTFSNAGTIANY